MSAGVAARSGIVICRLSLLAAAAVFACGLRRYNSGSRFGVFG
jgi:hypothetical protein